ncbi:MAG: glycine cleavage system regulatory protein [Bradymonadia bacterium]|jgi:glycine cleavage system regulatory protein
MERQLVFTLVGPDRPGLVEATARAVADAGGNWLDSRMTRLGGFFAGVVRVDGGTNADAVVAAVRALSEVGLQVEVARGAAAAVIEGGRESRISVVGNDRPGIVRQVAEVIARSDVNVEDLTTCRESAPVSGAPLFRAEVVVRAQDAASLEQLRDDLEALAHDLMVDLSELPN